MHTVGSVWPVGSKSGAQAETPPHYESQTQQMPKSIHTQACHFSVMGIPLLAPEYDQDRASGGTGKLHSWSFRGVAYHPASDGEQEDFLVES